jgi:mRNA interferase MazF
MAGLTDNLIIKRGEIWTADLRPGQGYEIAKVRPALVVSSDSINSNSPMIIILPISSQKPSHLSVDKILLTQKQTGLTKDSIILIAHIRSIDKSRLTKKVGRIQKTKLAEIEESLKIVLGLVPDL